MAAADTNIVLRLLLRDDEAQYRQARAFLDEHRRLFISHIVLCEIVWVLTAAYKVPKEQVCASLELLTEVSDFVLQDVDAVKGALTNYRRSSADFSDCLILATAERQGELPLGTFDAKLSRLSGAIRIGRPH